jgi:hypothetical protein
MKKNITFLSAAAIVAVLSLSCSPDAKKEEASKEVIIVPTKTVIIEKEPEKKSTTITLDKNG